jgi:hypothetical protein
MEARELIVEIRKLVERRMKVELSDQAALRLEHRILDAITKGRLNVFNIARRTASARAGAYPWPK